MVIYIVPDAYEYILIHPPPDLGRCSRWTETIVDSLTNAIIRPWHLLLASLGFSIDARRLSFGDGDISAKISPRYHSRHIRDPMDVVQYMAC